VAAVGAAGGEGHRNDGTSGRWGGQADERIVAEACVLGGEVGSETCPSGTGAAARKGGYLDQVLRLAHVPVLLVSVAKAAVKFQPKLSDFKGSLIIIGKPKIVTKVKTKSLFGLHKDFIKLTRL
jgi:hypothetical protein